MGARHPRQRVERRRPADAGRLSDPAGRRGPAGLDQVFLAEPESQEAIRQIQDDLVRQIDYFREIGKPLEAKRLEERTNFDLEMIRELGYCSGIENYSRYLTGRKPGEPPPTMFEYLPDNALVFVDESHQTIPQLGAMYRGDFNRKRTLAEYGFRLPSCLDNRPLKFEEWEAMRPQTVHVSATPGPWELDKTGGVFTEQVIRPTGLLDPERVRLRLLTVMDPAYVDPADLESGRFPVNSPKGETS